MTGLKTRPTGRSVAAFLSSIRDPEARRDCRRVAALMRKLTGARARMWGPSIVGFGTYRYRYPTGREGAWFRTGFSPRKDTLTLYIMSGFSGHKALLRRLGPHRTGRSCLYVKRLDDISLQLLERLIRESLRQMKRRWG